MKLIPLGNIDTQRLTTHLFAALLGSIGGAVTMNSSISDALRLWFGASLIYTSGFIQQGTKGNELLHGDDTKVNTIPLNTSDKQSGPIVSCGEEKSTSDT